MMVMTMMMMTMIRLILLTMVMSSPSPRDWNLSTSSCRRRRVRRGGCGRRGRRGRRRRRRVVVVVVGSVVEDGSWRRRKRIRVSRWRGSRVVRVVGRRVLLVRSIVVVVRLLPSTRCVSPGGPWPSPTAVLGVSPSSTSGHHVHAHVVLLLLHLGNRLRRGFLDVDDSTSEGLFGLSCCCIGSLFRLKDHEDKLSAFGSHAIEGEFDALDGAKVSKVLSDLLLR